MSAYWRFTGNRKCCILLRVRLAIDRRMLGDTKFAGALAGVDSDGREHLSPASLGHSDGIYPPEATSVWMLYLPKSHRAQLYVNRSARHLVSLGWFRSLFHRPTHKLAVKSYTLTRTAFWR